MDNSIEAKKMLRLFYRGGITKDNIREYSEEDILIVMKSFAKLHVEAALKAILDKVKITDDKWDDVLNAYPETNIK